MRKAMRGKKVTGGLTLLELVTVIFIVGILSTLGFVQFGKMVEKSRTAEAKMILGQLRTAQRAYYLKNGSYSTSMDLGIDAPTICVSTHYFYYSIPSASDSDFILMATRCTSSDGKSPPGSSDFNITVDADGDWDGAEGYY